MKYVILSLMFLIIGCNDFTQNDIDEAAHKQLSHKNKCETIAQSLGAKADFRKENGNWLCLVYKKTKLNNPWSVFYEYDLEPISRYLYIKEK